MFCSRWPEADGKSSQQPRTNTTSKSRGSDRGFQQEDNKTCSLSGPSHAPRSGIRRWMCSSCSVSAADTVLHMMARLDVCTGIERLKGTLQRHFGQWNLWISLNFQEMMLIIHQTDWTWYNYETLYKLWASMLWCFAVYAYSSCKCVLLAIACIGERIVVNYS